MKNKTSRKPGDLLQAYKKKVNNKLRGAYGETDLDRKTIVINKKTHKGKDHAGWVRKNKNGTANLLDTILHEEMHAKHPRMHEKNVRKNARRFAKKMSKKAKKKAYNRYK